MVTCQGLELGITSKPLVGVLRLTRSLTLQHCVSACQQCSCACSQHNARAKERPTHFGLHKSKSSRNTGQYTHWCRATTSICQCLHVPSAFTVCHADGWLFSAVQLWSVKRPRCSALDAAEQHDTSNTSYMHNGTHYDSRTGCSSVAQST